MKFIEEHGDLFEKSSTDKYCYMHCIASDFGMGGGIAVQFIKNFDMKSKLKLWANDNCIPQNQDNTSRYPSRPTLVGKAVLIDNTFNLITKTYTYQIPTYQDITNSLIDASNQIVQLGIKEVFIPDMICCGIDMCDRDKIIKIIKDVFKGVDVNIHAVKLI